MRLPIDVTHTCGVAVGVHLTGGQRSPDEARERLALYMCPEHLAMVLDAARMVADLLKRIN
jgi:hypothetical protein